MTRKKFLESLKQNRSNKNRVVEVCRTIRYRGTADAVRKILSQTNLPGMFQGVEVSEMREQWYWPDPDPHQRPYRKETDKEEAPDGIEPA